MNKSVSKTNKTCPNNTIQYVVKSGDSLYKIATRNKTSIEVLLELNPELNTSLLIPGIVMCIPANVSAPTTVIPETGDKCPYTNSPINQPTETPATPNTTPTETVPPGGMPIPELPSIEIPTMPNSETPMQPMMPPWGTPMQPTMPSNGTSTSPMMPSNGMQPMRPLDGMPSTPMTPSNGMPMQPMRPTDGMPMQPMRPTDGMPMQPMRPSNGMSPMTPITPQKWKPLVPSTTEVACNEQMRYTIRQGDTLYNLAKRHDITLYELLNANQNVNPYNLQVGQVICIPMSTSRCPYGKVYTVASDDTLTTILSRFRISLANLREVNENFDPYNIKAGTRLCIPAFIAYDNCPSERTYVIQSGENLTRISENLMISQNDLLAFNPNMRPEDFAVVGLRICLPAQMVPVR